jgi:hypothetical protein
MSTTNRAGSKRTQVILTRLEQDVFPVLGAMRVAGVRHDDILATLR